LAQRIEECVQEFGRPAAIQAMPLLEQNFGPPIAISR
jgi:hypothetical protein